MRHYIPNFITLLNLFCGSCAVVAIINGQVEWTLALLAFSIVADYLDGATAAALKVKSTLGKELDSLADMVTFGLLPGVILYQMLAGQSGDTPGFQELLWPFTPVFVITLFSALRLAKFNIDTRQSENFLGLPTPSSTIFVAGLLAIHHYDSFGLAGFVAQPWLLIGAAIFLSYLLVSEIPMFNLKMTHFKWSGNEIKYTFAGVSIGLLVVLGIAGPASIILLYILLNLGLYWFGATSPDGTEKNA